MTNVSALSSVSCGSTSLQLKSLSINKDFFTGPTGQFQAKVSLWYNIGVNSEISSEIGSKKFLINTLEDEP